MKYTAYRMPMPSCCCTTIRCSYGFIPFIMTIIN